MAIVEMRLLSIGPLVFKSMSAKRDAGNRLLRAPCLAFTCFLLHAETDDGEDEAVSVTLEESIDKLESSGIEVRVA